MANAHVPLVMSGEQFQHSANLFVTSQAKNLRHAEVESAKTLIHMCDGSAKERTRKCIRGLDECQTEEKGTEFLFDLRQSTKLWMVQTDPGLY